MANSLFGGFIQKIKESLYSTEWRKAIKSETGARMGSVSISTAAHYVVWEEPNRAGTSTLHIGDSGERFPTITGVWWLDRTRMVVAHRCGMRVGVFDTSRFQAPEMAFEVSHQTDDIAAKPLGEDLWEVVVSGCFACIYSRFTLQHAADAPSGWASTFVDSKTSDTKAFCHGVAYDSAGRLCWSIHTGVAPRFAIGDTIHRLPDPWGVRDTCEDRDRGRYLAIAVSKNPRDSAYDDVVTTIWFLADPAQGWQCLAALPGVHSDAIGVWGGHLFIPDQLGDRLLVLDAVTGDVVATHKGDCLDFPHGLGISPDGLVAVTNYGSSSVVVLDARTLVA